MVIITDRDLKLMAMCAAAQWLTTAQIQRHLFPAAAAPRVATRLRELRSAKFMHSVYGRIGTSPMLFHTLGPAGRSALLAHGWRGGPIQLRSALPCRLAHLAGINDIRIEVAASECKVNHFFSHWQLDPSIWPHAVIPDAGFSVDAPYRINFLVEFDRGTEPRSVLDTKIDAYAELRSSFFFTALLFVVEHADMVPRLVEHFGPRASFPMLAGSLSGLIADGILAHRFADVSTSRSVALADLSHPPDAG